MTRTQIIKDALECNDVQAAIYESELRDVPTEKLIDFFRYRLNFIERYASKELATKTAIESYRLKIVEARLQRGERVFADIEAMVSFIKKTYKGREFCYGGAFFDYVRIGLDEDGDLISKWALNQHGKFSKLDGEQTQRVYEWLFANQHRIGVVKFIPAEPILEKLEQERKEREELEAAEKEREKELLRKANPVMLDFILARFSRSGGKMTTAGAPE